MDDNNNSQSNQNKQDLNYTPSKYTNPLKSMEKYLRENLININYYRVFNYRNYYFLIDFQKHYDTNTFWNTIRYLENYRFSNFISNNKLKYFNKKSKGFMRSLYLKDFS